MSTQSLLVELSTEELPPKALHRLGQSFAKNLVTELAARHLIDTAAAVQVFAAPRHLGAKLAAVSSQAATREVRLKGPSVSVGLDDQGNPSTALRKWADKQGVSLDNLTRESTGKQENFFAVKTVPGESLAGVISEVINAALAALPIPKLMQYQLADGVTTVSFVRPAHHLIVLHADQLLAAQVLGLQAGQNTYGHRFLGATITAAGQPDQPVQVHIDHADQYESRMRDAHVVASFDERRAQIAAMLDQQAQALNASLGEPAELAALLDEVTALVEWPIVYVGQFEDKFLQVPAECLILTMRTNQKYFPLFDANGALTNRFLICSNMAIEDPAPIIDGNERVVRPRLADAQFFFDQDRKVTLADRQPRLASVVYHAKLGSQAQRSERVALLSEYIATALNLDAQTAGHCGRAAQLAKTDLLTGMVGEFPELQGIMGTYYARHDGEPDAVADSLAEQYLPRYAGDQLPATDCGTVLALADKMETLAGMFSIGQRPSGDKDPFALRRHALGVLRMLIEKRLPVAVADLIDQAGKPFSASAESMQLLTQFMYERLAGYLRDAGHSSAHIAAVVDQRPARLDTVIDRLEAVGRFSQLEQAQALAAANKRIGNILRNAPVDPNQATDESLLEDGAERALADTISRLTSQVQEAMGKADFAQAMSLVAQARAPVDKFFEDVMVMAEDDNIRRNRLLMLSKLHLLMNQVADISKLANN